MYFLSVFLTALLLVSLISTNWPVKFYHHHLLKKLGAVLHCRPQKNGLAFTGVYSQIDTVYRGRELRIRFNEGMMDALRTSPGLEIRMKAVSPVVMGISRVDRKRWEWGDFRRFLTGDRVLDSEWFIVTDNLQDAASFFQTCKLAGLLTGMRGFMEQMQINRDEIIVCLRRFHSAGKIVAFLDRLNDSFPA